MEGENTEGKEKGGVDGRDRKRERERWGRRLRERKSD